jgi:hypothetical protein
MTMNVRPSASPISWILQMIECGCGQSLSPETLTGNLIAFAVTMQKLDRDPAFEARILGKRHFTHTSGAERRENSVTVRE